MQGQDAAPKLCIDNKLHGDMATTGMLARCIPTIEHCESEKSPILHLLVVRSFKTTKFAMHCAHNCQLTIHSPMYILYFLHDCVPRCFFFLHWLGSIYLHTRLPLSYPRLIRNMWQIGRAHV